MLDAQGARLELHVLDVIRRDVANTRPNVVRATGLGRTLVNQRLDELLDLDIIREGDVVAVPRGRSPRELVFNREKADVLCADIGAAGLFVGLANIGGMLLESVYIPHDVASGPEATLAIVEREFDRIAASRSALSFNVWGIGIGLPAPVEFSSGRPVSPPIMPSWNEYDVRGHLQAKYGVPVWVDNDTNLMVIGELRAGVARGVEDVVLFKVSTGIGAAMISQGYIHRGARGAAGDVGHVQLSEFAGLVCRCGKLGCLEAVAGGAAMSSMAAAAAIAGTSSFLTEAAADHVLQVSDVVRGFLARDPVCVALIEESARLVGENIARYINFFNPAMVILGGRVMLAGDAYLATIRNLVYDRSLPLATRDVVITRTELGEQSALIGAAHLAIDEIFLPEYFCSWAGKGAPSPL